jgi:hypothetical protein
MLNICYDDNPLLMLYLKRECGNEESVHPVPTQPFYVYGIVVGANKRIL